MNCLVYPDLYSLSFKVTLTFVFYIRLQRSKINFDSKQRGTIPQKLC